MHANTDNNVTVRDLDINLAEQMCCQKILSIAFISKTPLRK